MPGTVLAQCYLMKTQYLGEDMEESTGFSNGPYKGFVSGEMGKEQRRRRQIFFFFCQVLSLPEVCYIVLLRLLLETWLSIFEEEFRETLKPSQGIAVIYPQGEETDRTKSRLWSGRSKEIMKCILHLFKHLCFFSHLVSGLWRKRTNNNNNQKKDNQTK